MTSKSHFSQADWDACLKVLRALSRDPDAAPETVELHALVTKLYKQAKKLRRKQARAADIHLLGLPLLRQENLRANHPLRAPATSWAPPESSSPIEPPPCGELRRARKCYVCQDEYRLVHGFYHMLCPECAADHWRRRHQRADLSGRTALITGGRVKVGYHLGLKLLRDGARVLITTRFPHDALRRFAAVEDFDQWHDRLRIYQLDFRYLPGLEQLLEHLVKAEPYLDILINNAAQTVRRSSEFYQNLESAELMEQSKKHQGLLGPSFGPSYFALEKLGQNGRLGTSTDADLSKFSLEVLDSDGQPADLREQNSWRLTAGEVPLNELLETQLVNSIAPFRLASHLKPLLARSPASRRFVVNVSAREGQFTHAGKTHHHPHTNMAKAALNMFTRTSAKEFARSFIYMNSVDTGWITEENPYPVKSRILDEQNFVSPLDAMDGAARIYDPIVSGINSADAPVWGQLLKNFQPHPW